MAKQVLPLSDIKIRKAKPKQKVYKLYDGGGLILYVTPKCKKVFRYKYKLDGKEKTITIGDYGIFSLKEAREIAGGYRKNVQNRVDPKNENKKSLTLLEVAKEFFETKKRDFSIKHLFKQQRRAEIYIYPFVGNIDIKNVTKREVADIIKNVKNIKTPSTKSGDKVETARRVFILLRQILSFAIYSDYIDTNPSDKINIKAILPVIKSKNFKAIIKEDEIKKMYKIIQEEANESKIFKAVEFMALTALRPGNVRFLKWKWISFEDDIIVFPKEQMKTNTDYRIPLQNRTKKILLEMRKNNKILKSEYVFASTVSKTKTFSENTLNNVHKRLGFNHTSHGWRSSFSTICYEHQRNHGYSFEVIESQLAHLVGNSVTRAYMRTDFLEERRGLLKWWEEFLNS